MLSHTMFSMELTFDAAIALVIKLCALHNLSESQVEDLLTLVSNIYKARIF